VNCARLNQVLDAWLDGELDRATNADLSRHVSGCPACAALRTERISLIQTLRNAAPYYRAPAALRSRVRDALAATGTVAVPRARLTWL
jgi:anti-sigma factor RsiW